MSENNSHTAICGFCTDGYDMRKVHVCGEMPFGGQTRRQWLAGLAMQGIISFNCGHCEPTAELAYKYADAMLEYEKDEAKK